MGYLIGVAMVTFTIVIISEVWKLLVSVFWRPYALTRHFRKQGVLGPPYSLVYGSLHEIKALFKDERERIMDNHSHDITQRIMPHIHKWSTLYEGAFNVGTYRWERIFTCCCKLYRKI